MQGVSVPIPNPPTHAQNIVKKHDPTLEAYLTNNHWYDNEFPTQRVETMLAASCLRFLGGLTTLEFVLGLSDAIIERQGIEMPLSLQYALEILQGLSEKHQRGIIQQVKKTQVDDCINDVLELL